MNMKLAIFFIAIIFGGSLQAHAEDCSWSTLRDQKYDSSMTLGQVERIKAVRNASLQCLARQYFSNFIQRGVRIHYLADIPDSEDQAILEQELRVQALEQTIEF